MVKAPLLICWSGGLDSTMVLLKYLRDGVKEISTIYVELTNNSNKSKMELKARARIRDSLEKEFNAVIDDTCIKVGDISLPWGASLMIQPLLWSFGMLVKLSDKKKEFKTLSFGYIREDDFWHIRKEFESIIKLGLCFTDPNFMLDCEFQYPLEWFSKQEVWDMYGDAHKHIRDLTWTCEAPYENKFYDMVECGGCKPCNVKAKLTGISLAPIPCEPQLKDAVIQLSDTVKEVFPEPPSINQVGTVGIGG